MRKKIFFGTVSDVDLRLMRVLTKVVECGSLSAAETELGVGRSTISRQISDIETRLGMRLLHRERGRRGFQLTQQGQKAMVYIEQLLSATDQFVEDIATINENLVGTLDICMTDFTYSDDKNPLTRVMQTFHQVAPNVTINLMVGSPREIEKRLIERKAHIGILHRYTSFEELNYEPLYSEASSVYAGSSHPLVKKMQQGEKITPSEAQSHQLISREYRESSLQNDLKSRFKRGPTVHETEAVAALVKAGIYLGYLPDHKFDGREPEFHQILPNAFSYSSEVHMAFHKSKVQSAHVAEFLKMLRNGASNASAA
ncbi:LysR family transcriptional regulator [Shimia sp.]|uniref:LysR family transcriptional regulator n=1 Tax=Shimia sp. TaxID=1954381 RepID=UPI003BA9ADF2